MNYKIRKTAEQLTNEYYYEGDKGPQLGGGADQESEVTEEVNEEMEARDMDGFTPGNDNLIIDKNSNPGDKFANTIDKLKKLAILVNSEYARDLIKATIRKIENKN